MAAGAGSRPAPSVRGPTACLRVSASVQVSQGALPLRLRRRLSSPWCQRLRLLSLAGSGGTTDSWMVRPGGLVANLRAFTSKPRIDQELNPWSTTGASTRDAAAQDRAGVLKPTVQHRREPARASPTAGIRIKSSQMSDPRPTSPLVRIDLESRRASWAVAGSAGCRVRSIDFRPMAWIRTPFRFA